MKYVRWFPGDYLRDTMHLTWEEDLAYRRMLDLAYCSEKGLPAERARLYSMVRATTSSQKQAIESIVKQFFTNRNGKLSNSKQVHELLRYRKIRAKRVTAGKQRAKLSAHAEQVLPNPYPYPTPDKYIREEKSFRAKRERLPDLDVASFEIFWDAYPKKISRQEAKRSFAKHRGSEHIGEIIASIDSWKQTDQWSDPQFIPYPATWLNKGLWKETPLKGSNGNGHHKTTAADQRSRETAAALRRVLGSTDERAGGSERALPDKVN